MLFYHTEAHSSNDICLESGNQDIGQNKNHEFMGIRFFYFRGSECLDDGDKAETSTKGIFHVIFTIADEEIEYLRSCYKAAKDGNFENQ